MARRKTVTDDDFLNQPIDQSLVERIKGKVPTRSEAIASAKDRKESRFTARVSKRDFEEFKKISARIGIGYQTLLGSIIHQYVNGRLIDIEEVRKLIPNLKVG